MSGKLSPCVTCTRVADPMACENKNCRVWRQWFLDRWERIRGYARRQKDEAPAEPVGVPLGGRRYAAPHQVERYLSSDPCKCCLCPRDLCSAPCRVRLAWENAGKEVSE